MSIYVLTLIIYINTHFINAQIIPPKISNSTGDYYYSSDSTFIGDTILCGQNNCYIECDSSNGCQSVSTTFTINAINSQQLTLICSAYLSCSTLVLYGPHDANADIACTGRRSCNAAELTLNNTNEVNVYCNYTIGASSTTYTPCYNTLFFLNDTSSANFTCAEFACYFTNIYAQNMASNSNGVDILCTGERACYGADIYCPHDYNTPCNIHGYDDLLETYSQANIYIKDRLYSLLSFFCITNSTTSNMCYFTEIYCIDYYGIDQGKSQMNDYSYNAKLGSTWRCSGFSCCPINWMLDTIDICAPGQDCTINCDNTTVVPNGCNGATIDAAEASSLTLICDNPTQTGFGCFGTHILCPTTNNSSCDIDCTESNACSDTIVQLRAFQIETFQLRCNYNACPGLYRIVTDGVNSVSNFIFNMYGSSGGIGLNNQDVILNINPLAMIDNLLFDCQPDRSCEKVQFYAETTELKNLMMNCGNDACSNMQLYLLAADQSNININCNDDWACYLMNFNIAGLRNANVNIKCDSIGTNTACEYSKFHVNEMNINEQTNNISLYCGQNDCISDTSLIFPFTLDAEYSNIVNVNCSLPNACELATIGATYAKNVNIYCGDDHSCDQTQVYCPYNDANICSITCNDNNKNVCNGIQIYVPDADQWYEYLDFDCNGTENANPNLTLNACSNVSITCFEHSGKSLLVYDAGNDNWICGTFGCCPWNTGLINCAANQDCVVDCSLYTDGCANKYIDGTLANSLTVYCNTANNTNYGCTSSKIKCPYSDNTFCNIHCSDSQSCSYTEIGICSNIDSFTMDCSVENACNKPTLFATFSDCVSNGPFTINSYDINCLMNNSCTGLDFEMNNIERINTFQLNCATPYSCNDSFILNNPNNINLSHIFTTICSFGLLFSIFNISINIFVNVQDDCNEYILSLIIINLPYDLNSNFNRFQIIINNRLNSFIPAVGCDKRIELNISSIN
eukprot:491711_1